LRVKGTYFRQSVAAVLIALTATLIVIWDQAAGVKAALRPDPPVSHTEQQVDGEKAFDMLEKQRETDFCILWPICFGGLSLSPQKQNPLCRSEKV
jgi:hypothetical protein